METINFTDLVLTTSAVLIREYHYVPDEVHQALRGLGSQVIDGGQVLHEAAYLTLGICFNDAAIPQRFKERIFQRLDVSRLADAASQ